MSLYKKHEEQENKSYTHNDLALLQGLAATAELIATVRSLCTTWGVLSEGVAVLEAGLETWLETFKNFDDEVEASCFCWTFAGITGTSPFCATDEADVSSGFLAMIGVWETREDCFPIEEPAKRNKVVEKYFKYENLRKAT